MVEVGNSNDPVELVLRRHKHGIRIDISAKPEVENFFRHWSGEYAERPQHGRLWRAPDNAPITIWSLGNHQNLAPSPTRPYSLVHGGAGLYTEHGYPNISFLRLVGVSEPGGRTIIVETVLGRGEIAVAAQRMIEAINLFYSEYLQDVHVRAVVSLFNLPASAAA